jgi:cephalosporin hydroxylase
MTPQPMANLPTWLHMAAQIYAPQQVLLVGAGNGTGPVVQALLGLQAMPRFASLQAHALEAHAPTLAQLAKRLGPDSTWQLSADVVIGSHGDATPTYHHYSLGTESSLLPPSELQTLWPSLQLMSEQPASSGVPINNLLHSLPPSPWLLLDCLPAAHLLQGADLSHTHVLLARVVLGAPDASPSGSTLAELQAQLAPQGYQLAACFAERNTQLAKTLWLRDPAWLQQQAKAKADQALSEQSKVHEAQAKDRAQELQALQAKIAAEAQAKQDLQAQKAQALAQAADLTQANEQSQTQLKAAQAELQQAKAQAEQLAQSHAQQLEKERAQAAQALSELSKAHEAQAKSRAQELQALQAELALVKTQGQKQAQEQTQKIDQAQQKIEQTQAELQSQHIDSDALKKIKEEWAEVNKNPYAHNRVLTSSLNASLREFTSKNLGLQHVKPAYLDYLAVKAQQVEKNCVGRLATTVQDAVTRQLVLECLSGDQAHILEIGALYGIGLAMLYNHATTRFQDVKLVCLDPFDGYYGKAVDALLNQPVNDLTFQRNMKLANVPDSDYAIIKRYSTDPRALQEVGDHTFNVLVVDGDHSYEGVKFDFENYFPLLEKGGYVILDDYNAKEWPGVQQFVDEDLKKHANFQYLGAFSRTAIGRKLY